MCEYCSRHGAGKKWFLNARNFVKNYEDDGKREEFLRDFVANFVESFKHFASTGQIKKMLENEDPNFVMKKAMTWYFRNKHSGQVITQEEAKMVLDLAGQISLVPCVCRLANSGQKKSLCMLFMNVPDDVWGAQDFINIRELVPLDMAEAKQQIDDFASDGLVQTVWTFNSPHIGAICNCDYPYCTAVRYRKNSPVKQSLMKGEQYATVNQSKCRNCKKCIVACQFGALSYSSSLNQMVINERQCFGCGICREKCKYDAIELEPRSNNPITRNLW